ncbi:MAG: hypothetical protein ACXQTL_02240 [Methanosarcinales archaeon]
MAICKNCHRTMRRDVLSRHKKNCIPQGKSMEQFHRTKSSFAQIEKAKKKHNV